EISQRARNTRGQASSSREETMEEKVHKFELFNYKDHQMNYDNLVGHSIHLRDVNLFQINKPIFRELVREFFASFEFDACPCRFNMGNTKSKSIRDPKIKLAHGCITMTITGRKETTNRVIEINLFYLYCIFGEGVVCNVPYWLAKYLKGVRDKSVIFGRMFVTKIAQALRGECCWPVTRVVVEEDEGDDEEGDGEEGNEGAGSSTDIYRNMSAGDWQIDLFPRFEAGYPPYGYHGHMPPGYTYRPDPLQDGSS
nr:hypothetical protein [Tanacetum cinerariifolium]